jgi:hypothetical protein
LLQMLGQLGFRGRARPRIEHRGRSIGNAGRLGKPPH